MMQVRKSEERGHSNHGWLDSKFSFSFADYYDPDFMGFRDLRVINEDKIQGGTGFPTHPHRDMEIITYVIDGALEHKDSTGTSAVIRPGEVQRMSAGTGIQHSEYNHLKDKATHLLQIWIMPNKRGIQPGYEQKDFAGKIASGNPTLVVSPDGRDGSVRIQQDAELWVAKWARANEHSFTLRDGRYAWLQVVSGALDVNGTPLAAGDGAALYGEPEIRVKSAVGAEFLYFDLP